MGLGAQEERTADGRGRSHLHTVAVTEPWKEGREVEAGRGDGETSAVEASQTGEERAPNIHSTGKREVTKCRKKEKSTFVQKRST